MHLKRKTTKHREKKGISNLVTTASVQSVSCTILSPTHMPWLGISTITAHVAWK